MVTKKKSKADEKKKGRVKVGKLNLNKETVRDLTPGEKKQVGGGIGGFIRVIRPPAPTNFCPTNDCPTIYACPTYLPCPSP